jgi:hypothetical protein
MDLPAREVSFDLALHIGSLPDSIWAVDPINKPQWVLPSRRWISLAVAWYLAADDHTDSHLGCIISTACGRIGDRSVDHILINRSTRPNMKEGHMPEAEVYAVQLVHVVAVAIPLILALVGYGVYRIVKERKRRVARREYVENSRGTDEEWFTRG